MFGDGKFSRIIVILAAALICTGQAFAQSSLKVVNATGAAGSDVTVKVTLSSDKNIAGAEFQVQFDPARLTFKQAAKGSAAAAFYMTDPVVPTAGQQTVGSDSSKLHFQLIDSTRANSIASGTDREVVLITFTIKTGVSGSIPLTLSGASLSDAAGAAVTVTTTNGEVTVGSAVDIALDVTDAQGPAGSDVTVKVMANVNRETEALGFSLLFDKDKLALKSIVRGANAPGVDTLDTYTEIAAANAAGLFNIWLVDFFYDTPSANPLKVGTSREVYKFTFTIKSGVADGETPVTLAQIEAGAIENNADVLLTYSALGGVIKVGGVPGDVDGSGRIDVFDLLGLLKVLGGTQASSALSDIDGNGKTDVFDLLALLKKLAGN
jgi:hypothetical protein